MKTFIQSLIITVVLIIIFSSGYFPKDIFPSFGSIGTEYPGDSGMVLPGGGSEMAEVVIQSVVNRTEIQEPSEGIDEARNETSDSADKVENEIQTEIEMEVHNKMGDIMLSFWHGVAAVLIGETAALMVATAYLKIRRANDGK